MTTRSRRLFCCLAGVVLLLLISVDLRVEAAATAAAAFFQTTAISNKNHNVFLSSRSFSSRVHTAARTDQLTHPGGIRSRTVRLFGKKKKRIDGNGDGGTWNTVKEIVYSSVDGVKAVPEVLERLKGQGPTIKDGYSDVEERFFASSGKTKIAAPGQKLLREYEQRKLTASSSPPLPSTFDKVKDAFYGTIDAITNNDDDDMKPLTTSQPSPIEEPFFPASEMKPVVQETLSSWVTSPQVQEVLKGLESEQPLQRLTAQRKLDEFQRTERQRRARDAANCVKESAYLAADALNTVQDTVAALASLPEKVQQGAESAAAVAKELEQTVAQVKTSVAEGVETSQKVIRDVQNLPKTIETTVDSVTTAVKTVTDTVTTVSDAAIQTQVNLGLAPNYKFKPKPPRDSPPMAKPIKEQVQDLGWKAVDAVGKEASKAAMFVGKEAAKSIQRRMGVEVEDEIDESTDQRFISDSTKAAAEEAKSNIAAAEKAIRIIKLQRDAMISEKPKVPPFFRMSKRRQQQQQEEVKITDPAPPPSQASKQGQEDKQAQFSMTQEELVPDDAKLSTKQKGDGSRSELGTRVEDALKLAEEAMKTDEND